MQDDGSANLRVAERVAELLEQARVPLVVIGAVALAAHRYARFTEDIDLGVLAAPGEMRALVELLGRHGFDAVHHEPDAQDPLGGVIDVAGPFGLVQIINFEDRFPEVIRDALAGDCPSVRPGSPLRIVPIPHLVALKLYAGGLKSHADILELLRRNPEADLGEIREICRRYRLPGLDAILGEW